MEAFAMYLLKSAVWLTGFTLVYLLFLRDERFFMLKRMYLISGILISFIFPFITFHYQVEMVASEISAGELSVDFQDISSSGSIDYKYILLILYLSGILFFTLKLFWQARSLYITINKANINNLDQAKLIRTSEISSSFSFLNYVFINPSVNETEEKEIMNHELVHVHQKHWFDLFLVELLCMFQWANPFAWIYSRIIRLNHEYLADEAALQRSIHPAIYKATLLNQMFSSPVISLSNSFSYSLNKKRFDMMKKTDTSPYRKMKVLFVLPVFAFVFYAFATPEYSYTKAENSPGSNNMVFSDQKEVKGTVVQQDGKPLQGAVVILQGTTKGTVSDAKGFFRLGDITDDRDIVISYVGYKSKVMKPVFNSDMTIKMIRDTLNLEQRSTMPSAPPPPPPPPPVSSADDKSGGVPPPPPPPFTMDKINILSESGNPPLYILDGKTISKPDVDKIDPETIESISVYKNEESTKRYGDKGKNGVVDITSKKKYVVVETMPEFPGGGTDAMWKWIREHVKYPEAAAKSKIMGKVYVDFMVSSTGEIKDVVVSNPVNPLLDAEAIRVVSAMPAWIPGTQSGKPVDVRMTVPIQFLLH